TRSMPKPEAWRQTLLRHVGLESELFQSPRTMCIVWCSSTTPQSCWPRRSFGRLFGSSPSREELRPSQHYCLVLTDQRLEVESVSSSAVAIRPQSISADETDDVRGWHEADFPASSKGFCFRAKSGPGAEAAFDGTQPGSAAGLRLRAKRRRLKSLWPRE